MSISRPHLKEVCRIGQGKACCRYITVGADGFVCAKNSSLKSLLDDRVCDGKMVAQGDNCNGISESVPKEA